jgi:D-alanyl-D-alanine carboxypeptidase
MVATAHEMEKERKKEKSLLQVNVKKSYSLNVLYHSMLMRKKNRENK